MTRTVRSLVLVSLLGAVLPVRTAAQDHALACPQDLSPPCSPDLWRSGDASAIAPVGDVNADGFDDLLVGYRDARSAELFLGGPDGPSAQPDQVLTSSLDGFGRAVLGPGDLNGDGFDDVVVGADLELHVHLGGSGGVAAVSSSSVPLLPNRCDGGDGFYRLASAGDVDGDGLADVLLSMSGAFTLNNGMVRLHRGRAGGLFGNFAWSATTSSCTAPFAAGAGDLNGDGWPDVAISWFDGGSGQVELFLNGAGTLPVAPTSTRDLPGAEHGLVFVDDVDGDGDDELAAGVFDLVHVVAGSPAAGLADTWLLPRDGDEHLASGDLIEGPAGELFVGSAVHAWRGGAPELAWTIPEHRSSARELELCLAGHVDGDGLPDLLHVARALTHSSLEGVLGELHPGRLAPTHFTGALDQEWDRPANWTRGIPDCGQDAIVEPGAALVLRGGAQCLNLQVGAGASLTLDRCARLVVHRSLQLEADIVGEGLLVFDGDGDVLAEAARALPRVRHVEGTRFVHTLQQRAEVTFAALELNAGTLGAQGSDLVVNRLRANPTTPSWPVLQAPPGTLFPLPTLTIRGDADLTELCLRSATDNDLPANVIFEGGEVFLPTCWTPTNPQSNQDPSTEFANGTFHVPSGSAGNDFERIDLRGDVRVYGVPTIGNMVVAPDTDATLDGLDRGPSNEVEIHGDLHLLQDSELGTVEVSASGSLQAPRLDLGTLETSGIVTATTSLEVFSSVSGSGTVTTPLLEFDGSTSSLGVPLVTGNVAVQGSDLTLLDDVVVDGYVNVNQGGRLLGTHQLTVQGHLRFFGGLLDAAPPEIVVHGNYHYTAATGPTQGRVVLTGPTAIITGSNAGEVRFHDLLVPAGASVDIDDGLGALRVNGTLEVEDGGALLAEGAQTLHLPGGLHLVGMSGTPARLGATGAGALDVRASGLIEARHFQLDGLAADGFQVLSGASFGAAPLDFREGTLTSPSAAAGSTLLTLNLDAAHTFRDLAFDDPLAVGTFNVRGASGAVGTFLDAVGPFAGPAFEDDPGGLVEWTTSSRALASGRAPASVRPGSPLPTAGITLSVGVGGHVRSLEQALSLAPAGRPLRLRLRPGDHGDAHLPLPADVPLVVLEAAPGASLEVLRVDGAGGATTTWLEDLRTTEVVVRDTCGLVVMQGGRVEADVRLQGAAGVVLQDVAVAGRLEARRARVVLHGSAPERARLEASRGWGSRPAHLVLRDDSDWSVAPRAALRPGLELLSAEAAFVPLPSGGVFLLEPTRLVTSPGSPSASAPVFLQRLEAAVDGRIWPGRLRLLN